MRIYNVYWPRTVSPSSSTVDGNSGEPRHRQPELAPGQPNQASPARLSPIAAMLGRVFSGTQEAITDRPAVPLAPLAGTHPEDTAGMATALRRSLALSGLFYESHLVRWFLGERLLAELLKEPQGRFSACRDGSPVREERSLPLEGGTPGQPLLEEVPRTGGAGASVSMEELLGPGSSTFLPIVREQLAILASGTVHCQGEGWPGQDMEWDVTRDGDGGEGGEESCWRTTIRLRLPGLGAVDAMLAICGTGIRGELKTDSPVTMELMKQELETLENRMAGSGLLLREMVIECESRE